MKKLTAYVCAAALLTASVQMPLPTAYAITVVSDAQTAVEKSMKELLSLIDKTDIDESFTRDDLENLIFEACDYTVDGSVGVGYLVDKFRIASPEDGNAGYMSADIILYLDDAEEAYSIKKEFSSSGSLSIDDGNSNSQSTDNTSNENAAESKKSIESAKKAISAAIWDFDVSNNTTADDILNMAKTAAGNESGVKITLNKADFKLTKASTTVDGSLSATLTLNCGGISDRVAVGKTVPLVVTENSILIEEDRAAVSKALENIVYTNKTTKEDMLAAALGAVKNGSTVAWKDNFVKKNATVEEAGELLGYLVMTLEEETREMRISEEIPQLIGKMPTGKLSVNKEEWEILRKTNIERAKVGDNLLSMISPLQAACDIREKEINESFSHTRPNGTAFKTAIDDLSKYAGVGENINKCTPGHGDAERAMTSWMNSPGHKANILKEGYDFIGVGNDLTHSVQIFAISKNPVTSVTTSAGTMTFADEDTMIKEYVICKTSDGIESYMPISVEALTKVDGGYQMKLNSTVPVIFTIGDSTTGTNVQPNTGGTVFTDVKAGDYFEIPVKWAVEKKITTGTTSTTFSPEQTCTRAQILTFLWRAVGSPKASAENPFSDISADDYYFDAAIWAYNKGMVSGNSFEGDTPCTRASTVEYLWKNANSPQNTASNSFEDVSANSDYAQAVSWAVENGVTTGTSNTTFSPDTICSRGQIVTFLNRAIKD